VTKGRKNLIIYQSNINPENILHKLTIIYSIAKNTCPKKISFNALMEGVLSTA
jgi:hypothetical protein